MRTISIAAVSERFPGVSSCADRQRDEFADQTTAFGGARIHDRGSADGVPNAMERVRTCGDSWNRRLALRLSRLRHQEDELTYVGGTAHQARARRRRSCRASTALSTLYNCVSLTYGQCLGADDADKTSGDLAFRFAQAGDTFIDMSAEPGEDPNDPPKDGEVVYADSRHVLCRRWNWRQDARTSVTPATKNAILTVQSNGCGEVTATAEALIRGIETECGGRLSLVVLDRSNPSAQFDACLTTGF